jgi:hypothetical protein
MLEWAQPGKMLTQSGLELAALGRPWTVLGPEFLEFGDSGMRTLYLLNPLSSLAVVVVVIQVPMPVLVVVVVLVVLEASQVLAHR